MLNGGVDIEDLDRRLWSWSFELIHGATDGLVYFRSRLLTALDQVVTLAIVMLIQSLGRPIQLRLVFFLYVVELHFLDFFDVSLSESDLDVLLSLSHVFVLLHCFLRVLLSVLE